MTIVAFSDPPSPIAIASSAEPWITNVQHENLSEGIDTVSFSATHNPAVARSGSVKICTETENGNLPVYQFSGKNTQTQIDQILGAPMVMEFGIATKYIGKQIANLPAEAQPFVLAAVETIYPLLGTALTAARESFVFLPTPHPVFDEPPILVPVTAECIFLQTVMQEIYLPIAVAEAE